MEVIWEAIVLTVISRIPRVYLLIEKVLLWRGARVVKSCVMKKVPESRISRLLSYQY